jgi:hypothetical protein
MSHIFYSTASAIVASHHHSESGFSSLNSQDFERVSDCPYTFTDDDETVEFTLLSWARELG